jgi:intracellular multiplication protein IcmO
MTVFDEVGYYTAQGMAVMAAQARSLGFCLVFSAQDLQAMEKRVKEEARSITANCNIKIFGKLQDPTQTREFFENHIGSDYVAKVSGYQLSGGMSTGSYQDNQQVSIDTGTRADYDDLKEMKEGEAIVSFGIDVHQANIFYSNPGHAKAMRVTRYLALPEPDEALVKHADKVTKLRDAMFRKDWTAMKADVALPTPEEFKHLGEGFRTGIKYQQSGIDSGVAALGALHAEMFPVEAQESYRNIVTAQNQLPVEAAPPDLPVSVDMPAETVEAEIRTVEEQPVISSEPATSPAVEVMKIQLDQDVQNILQKAGQDLQKALFTDQTD